MTTSPEEFLPTANRWFSPTLEYVGHCKAEFSAPQGSIEGPTTVSVDEAGNVNVQMIPEPESRQTEYPFQQLGLLRFFKGYEFVQEHGSGISTLDIEAENPCTKLEVQTPLGTFRTEEILYRFTESVVNTGEVWQGTALPLPAGGGLGGWAVKPAQLQSSRRSRTVASGSGHCRRRPASRPSNLRSS